MKILIVSTTSHTTNSTSKTLLGVLMSVFNERGHSVRFVDASELHIVNNLSCYASGKFNCASYDAGKYRCWAHKLSHENPSQYGGKDEMGVLYDGFEWADVVIFGTSVRWQSHSAILQKIIERMTTLQNRNVVYCEPNPLQNKKCGVVVTGHNSMAQGVADHLLRVFEWLGFSTHIYYQFVWQKTTDIQSEVPETSDVPALKSFLTTKVAFDQAQCFIEALEQTQN